MILFIFQVNCCELEQTQYMKQMWSYPVLVAGLCVHLGGQVVAALTHAAVGDLLQQSLSGLLRQILGVRHRHPLSQVLCDRQVMGQAQLHRLRILNIYRKTCQVMNRSTAGKVRTV